MATSSAEVQNLVDKFNLMYPIMYFPWIVCNNTVYNGTGIKLPLTLLIDNCYSIYMGCDVPHDTYLNLPSNCNNYMGTVTESTIDNINEYALIPIFTDLYNISKIVPDVKILLDNIRIG